MYVLCSHPEIGLSGCPDRTVSGPGSGYRRFDFRRVAEELSRLGVSDPHARVCTSTCSKGVCVRGDMCGRKFSVLTHPDQFGEGNRKPADQ